MDCPICNSSGIADESKNCPHCNADLVAFQLTKQIEKTGKGRLLFAWIASILFILVLLVLIFLMLVPKSNVPSEKDTQELAQLKTELDIAQKQNESLLTKNNELKAQIGKQAEETASREKVYVVRSGETLFSIARKVLGNGYKYQDIAKDNNISNPDIITIGQKLVIYY
jgi:cell division protein FtsB